RRRHAGSTSTRSQCFNEIVLWHEIDAAESFANHVAAQRRLLGGVRSEQRQCSARGEAVSVSYRDFVTVRGGSASPRYDTAAVGAFLVQRSAGEISHDVRCKIGGGVADLVKKLLRHRLHVH